MPAPRATEATIARVIRAAQSCGLSVSGVTVDKDGRVAVSTAPVAQDGDKTHDARTPIPW